MPVLYASSLIRQALICYVTRAAGALHTQSNSLCKCCGTYTKPSWVLELQ
jgi:hypothetical protein